MSYRDERAALAARIEALEAELARLGRRRVLATEEARDEVVEALGTVSGIGAPSSIRLSIALSHAVSGEGLDALRAVAAEVLDIDVVRVGAVLVSERDQLRISVLEHETRIALRRSWPTFTPTVWLVLVAAALGTPLVARAALAGTSGLPAEGALLVGAALLVPMVWTAVGLAVGRLVRVRCQSEVAASRHALHVLARVARRYPDRSPDAARGRAG